MNLIHLYFLLLQVLNVYATMKGAAQPLVDASLDTEIEDFSTKKELTSLTKYEEEVEPLSTGVIFRTTGVGFECHWLGKESKDRKKRCFVMEKRLIEDLRRIARQN